MSEMMHTSNANIEAKLEALMQQLQSNTLQGGTAPTDAFEAEEEVISIDRSFALQPEAFSSGSSGSSSNSGSDSQDEEDSTAKDATAKAETLAMTKEEDDI
jgi:hypothetical protein